MRFRAAVGILSVVFFAALGAGYLHSRFHRAPLSGPPELDSIVANLPAKPAEEPAPESPHESPSQPVVEKTAPEPCEPMRESAGDGSAQLKVSAGQWKKVMKEFHTAKHELSSWLGRVGTKHPPENISALQAKIEAIRLQRPPISSYPDLLWRGIALYTDDPQEGNVIRLGNGMAASIQKSPKKLRFELTRLLAQAWAPCELQKDPRLSSWAAAFWEPAMHCLGLSAMECKGGEYAESTWAISSALASRLSPQACSIAALNDDSIQQCLNQAFSISQETAWLEFR